MMFLLLTLPFVVDLAEPAYDWTWDFDKIENSLPFNGAPEIGVYVAHLRDLYEIEGAVETGTYEGGTTFYLAENFFQVDTIEIEEQRYNITRLYFQERPNVRCHLGSSEKVLAKILPEMKGRRLLFYLDAHWGMFCPLLDELDVIAKTHRDECIIMIDDFKVPERPEIPYDTYGDEEFCYEYTRDGLDKVFSEYSCFYLIPKNSYYRAKFVAIPKSWEKAQL